MLIVTTNIKLYDLYISKHVQASTSISSKMIFKRQYTYHLLIKINLHEKCTLKMLISLKHYHRTLYHLSFDFISKACILKSSNFKRTYFLNQKIFICKIMRNIIFLSLYNILVSEAELYYEYIKSHLTTASHLKHKLSL